MSRPKQTREEILSARASRSLPVETKTVTVTFSRTVVGQKIILTLAEHKLLSKRMTAVLSRLGLNVVYLEQPNPGETAIDYLKRITTCHDQHLELSNLFLALLEEDLITEPIVIALKSLGWEPNTLGSYGAAINTTPLQAACDPLMKVSFDYLVETTNPNIYNGCSAKHMILTADIPETDKEICIRKLIAHGCSVKLDRSEPELAMILPTLKSSYLKSLLS